MRLRNKIALITGAASGIGAAIADVFADAGARIVVVDLDAGASERRAAEIGRDAVGFGCDVSDPASVEAAVEQAFAATGRIDVLVNSAGIVDLAPAEDLSTRAWDRTLAVNLSGTFFMSQAVSRHMLAAGRGTTSAAADPAARTRSPAIAQSARNPPPCGSASSPRHVPTARAARRGAMTANRLTNRVWRTIR